MLAPEFTAARYFLISTLTSPCSSIISMAAPAGVRWTMKEIFPAPTFKSSILIQSSRAGMAGESMTSLCSKPSTCRPSIACTSMKTLAADQACG